MQVALKKTLIAIVLIVALLAALVGGIIRFETSSVHHSGMSSGAQLAWYCPAPPAFC